MFYRRVRDRIQEPTLHRANAKPSQDDVAPRAGECPCRMQRPRLSRLVVGATIANHSSRLQVRFWSSPLFSKRATTKLLLRKGRRRLAFAGLSTRGSDDCTSFAAGSTSLAASSTSFSFLGSSQPGAAASGKRRTAQRGHPWRTKPDRDRKISSQRLLHEISHGSTRGDDRSNTVKAGQTIEASGSCLVVVGGVCSSRVVSHR